MSLKKPSSLSASPLKNTGDWDFSELHATKYLLLCKVEKTLLLESVNLVRP